MEKLKLWMDEDRPLIPKKISNQRAAIEDKEGASNPNVYVQLPCVKDHVWLNEPDQCTLKWYEENVSYYFKVERQKNC